MTIGELYNSKIINHYYIVLYGKEHSSGLQFRNRLGKLKDLGLKNLDCIFNAEIIKLEHNEIYDNVMNLFISLEDFKKNSK